MPGCLIAFEGTEGSGKSSQVVRARTWLEGHVDLVVTREPGGTPTAEALRSLVVAVPIAGRDPASDAFLMNAARHDHCRRVIAPALARGAVVITDRFAASTLAYQGAGDGVAVEWLTSLEKLATGGLTPSRYVLFDLDVEFGLSRRLQAGQINAMDRRDVAFHRRVRDGYLRLAAASPASWSVIDATQPEEIVWHEVKAVLSHALRSARVETPL